MDPVLKSALTSMFVAVCGGILTTIGITTTQGQATVADAVIGALTLGVGTLVGWWKTRTHTQEAVIAAVNSTNNGVKVVAEGSPSPMVTAPLVKPAQGATK